MTPPGMTQRRHEHERLDLAAADLHQPPAEVDLQLPAWRRLEPHRRQRLGLQRLSVGLHRPLQRSQADGQALLSQQRGQFSMSPDSRLGARRGLEG